MKYQALIFDLDGTLLDTLDDLADSVNAALHAFGHPGKTRDEVRTIVGNGMLNLMDRVIPGGKDAPDFEDIFTYFRQHYAAHCEDKTAPYDGLPAQLLRWREAGVKMAIVSNKADFAVKKLAATYFGDTIPLAIGENEAAGIRKKPAPDTVELALRELGVRREDAVYIGDSEVDVVTARNAGMPCLSVTWGFRSRETLLAAGATVLIDTPQALYDATL